jgi:hypothetical protein
LGNEISKEMLIEKFNKSPETYFSKKRILFCDLLKNIVLLVIIRACVTYSIKIGFVECSAEGWQLKDYKDLNGFIWKIKSMTENFAGGELKKRHSRIGGLCKICFNISGKSEERFKSLCTIIGYGLHTYFEGN